jgi:hypothetical protein
MDARDIRASQAERDRVVDRLRDHAGEGRLDVGELEVRVERALCARTRGELETLVADLPPRRRTRRRARVRTEWVALSIMLIAIWALTGAGYFWPVWPIGGMAWWGLGAPGSHRRAHIGSRRDGVQAVRP